MFSDLPMWLSDWYFPYINNMTPYDHELYYRMCQVGKPCFVK